jgi:hypothetical protein
MSTVTEPLALEMMLRPLSRTLSRELAEALVNLRADAATQAHYDEPDNLALACPECNLRKGPGE